MSLINEALQKASNSAAGDVPDNFADTFSSDDVASVNAIRANPSTSNRWLLPLSMLTMIVAGTAVVLFFTFKNDASTVKTTVAAAGDVMKPSTITPAKPNPASPGTKASAPIILPETKSEKPVPKTITPPPVKPTTDIVEKTPPVKSPANPTPVAKSPDPKPVVKTPVISPKSPPAKTVSPAVARVNLSQKVATAPTTPLPQPLRDGGRYTSPIKSSDLINPIKLGGIAVSDFGASAIINGSVVRKGDEFDGIQVVDIDRRHVKLAAAGKTFFIRLK